MDINEDEFFNELRSRILAGKDLFEQLTQDQIIEFFFYHIDCIFNIIKKCKWISQRYSLPYEYVKCEYPKCHLGELWNKIKPEDLEELNKENPYKFQFVDKNEN